MTNQELFERAVAGNWIAESFDRPSVADGVGKFYLLGSGPGYTNFSDTIDDGSVVFYAAFDDDCNREAGYATFNATDQSLTPIESTATLQNDKYVDGDVAPVPFPKGGTITGTFNAVAFNAIWAHIWDKNNPHEVDAGQVEQDNENLLGDNVQDALDNLSGIIAEWDNAIKSTAQNYVQELPPPNPQKGDMWTDVGVTGEQYVWEGEYWVSVTGGGLGVDLDDLDSYSSKITTDVVDDDELYDIPLERVISSSTGEGKWVAGGDGSGVTFVPEAPEDGLQYGRENGEWTEIDAGGVWDSDGIEDVDGNATGHYYHLSNAENTNIFKTTIGSDEVEMMGLTSIQAAQIDVRGNDKSARFQGAGDNNFLEVNFVEQYNEVQLNTNATYFNLAKDGQVGFIFDGSLEGNFLNACSIGNIRIDGERIRGKGLNGVPGIGFFLSGATHEILPIDALGNELTEGPDFGSSTYRYKDGYFNGKVSASDFTDLDGNSIVGVVDQAPYFEKINISADYATGDVGQDAWTNVGGMVLQGGGGSGETSAYSRLQTYCFQPNLVDQGYVQWAFNSDDASIPAPSIYGEGVWAAFEHHNSPHSFFNVNIWGGRNVGKRAGIGALYGRCEFWEGHFEEVYSDSYLDKNGGAMMSVSDVIDGFSSVQKAVSDEVTVEGLRDAISNAVGGFIERLEARQAEVQAKVKKSADDYHELMEAHHAKTQEEKANG